LTTSFVNLKMPLQIKLSFFFHKHKQKSIYTHLWHLHFSWSSHIIS